MRKTLLASVSALVLSSSVVLAADMPIKAPPLPAPASAWTGFYVGLNAGYAWGNSDLRQIFDLGPTPVTGPPSLTPSGFIGGGQAGYNWQIGQSVFGGGDRLQRAWCQSRCNGQPILCG